MNLLLQAIFKVVGLLYFSDVSPLIKIPARKQLAMTSIYPNYQDPEPFNSQPSLVVASLDKMLHDDYFCVVESGKQQISQKKMQPENLKTKATPKRVWIRPTHSASVAFS